MSSNIHIQVPERVTCDYAWSRPDCEKDATYILVSIFGVPVGAVCDEHFRTYYRDNLRAIPLRVVSADVAPTSGICKACGKEYTTNCCDECWSKAEPVPNPDAPVASAERCATCECCGRKVTNKYEHFDFVSSRGYTCQPTDTTENDTSEDAWEQGIADGLAANMDALESQPRIARKDMPRPCLCDECNGVQHDTPRDERVTALLEMVRDLAFALWLGEPLRKDTIKYVRDRADAMLRARDGGGK